MQRLQTASTEAPAAPPQEVAVDPFASVIGGSAELLEAIALARRVAQYASTTVLLEGETGTGKELFSRGIHYAGPNASEPFVAINCAAIPEGLLESELFGHERGAFTDARATKLGLLELAGSGTLFLDEIGELPRSVQPKLLRVLEARQVRRLGGLAEHPIGCRIIAASHVDLARAVARGQFREDLYYRLSVFRIALPPLRARAADLEPLAHALVSAACRDNQLPPRRLVPEAVALLHRHAWPGNLRELKNALERAVIVAEGETIEPRHLTLQRRSTVPAAQATSAAAAASIDIPTTGLTLAAAERELIVHTLRLTQGNRSQAARLLGISRPTVLRKIREHGIAAPEPVR